jgi:hypothetical protein
LILIHDILTPHGLCQGGILSAPFRELESPDSRFRESLIFAGLG